MRSSPRLAAFLLTVAVLGGGCRTRDPVLAEPFRDDFERAELGPAWHATGPGYEIKNGRLNVAGAYNHPLWLRKKLPPNVVIDVDVTSNSPAGDIKIEPFGDGESFDPDKGSYVSTGYMLIFGGWNNSLSVICRNNEHDDGRKISRKDVRVEPGRTYHWTVERIGGRIDWRIDGRPFLAWTDPEPLAGPGHEYFAINNWEANVTFDNLSIRPLP